MKWILRKLGAGNYKSMTELNSRVRAIALEEPAGTSLYSKPTHHEQKQDVSIFNSERTMNSTQGRLGCFNRCVHRIVCGHLLRDFDGPTIKFPSSDYEASVLPNMVGNDNRNFSMTVDYFIWE
jgi:hypothetical protein